MRAMTINGSGQVVAAIAHGASRVVTISVGGEVVGSVLHAPSGLVPVGAAHVLPPLHDADEAALWADLEMQLPPAPVMPRIPLGRTRGVLRKRAGVEQAAA